MAKQTQTTSEIAYVGKPLKPPFKHPTFPMGMEDDYSNDMAKCQEYLSDKKQTRCYQDCILYDDDGAVGRYYDNASNCPSCAGNCSCYNRSPCPDKWVTANGYVWTPCKLQCCVKKCMSFIVSNGGRGTVE